MKTRFHRDHSRQRSASRLEDNRDEDDQDHCDGLGHELEEICDELIDCGVKGWSGLLRRSAAVQSST